MSVIPLIIKGSYGAALEAANKRDIAIQVLDDTRAGETLASCDAWERRKVVAWFAEPDAGAPYAPGTLLWYGADKESSDAAKERAGDVAKAVDGADKENPEKRT